MFENMRYQGSGSSLLRPYKLITPKHAFDANNVNYVYKKGYNCFNPNVDVALETLKANGEDAYVIGKIIKSDDKITII